MGRGAPHGSRHLPTRQGAAAIKNTGLPWGWGVEWRTAMGHFAIQFGIVPNQVARFRRLQRSKQVLVYGKPGPGAFRRRDNGELHVP